VCDKKQISDFVTFYHAKGYSCINQALKDYTWMDPVFAMDYWQEIIQALGKAEKS